MQVRDPHDDEDSGTAARSDLYAAIDQGQLAISLTQFHTGLEA